MTTIASAPDLHATTEPPEKLDLQERPLKRIVLAALAMWLAAAGAALQGCSPAFVTGVAQGISTANEGAAPPAKLMIFGGAEHKTYLGCLNCSELATDSALNRYGLHGSSYATDSIWNKFGQFGSRYSPYSACNRYASDPPVIVDATGKFYGRLTLNPYNPELGLGAKLQDWLRESVCSGR